MKQPAIRNITFTISKNVNWFLATLPNNPDAACEIPNCVQTKEKRVAAATISIIPPVVFADSISIPNKSLNLTSL